MSDAKPNNLPDGTDEPIELGEPDKLYFEKYVPAKLLAEAEAKVRELERENNLLKESETCGYCDFGRKHQDVVYKLQTTNAVLTKKLEKAVEQRNDFIEMDRHENFIQAYKDANDAELNAITAEALESKGE